MSSSIQTGAPSSTPKFGGGFSFGDSGAATTASTSGVTPPSSLFGSSSAATSSQQSPPAPSPVVATGSLFGAKKALGETATDVPNFGAGFVFSGAPAATPSAPSSSSSFGGMQSGSKAVTLLPATTGSISFSASPSSLRAATTVGENVSRSTSPLEELPSTQASALGSAQTQASTVPTGGQAAFSFGSPSGTFAFGSSSGSVPATFGQSIQGIKPANADPAP